jgi:hypothetical protein
MNTHLIVVGYFALVACLLKATKQFCAFRQNFDSELIFSVPTQVCIITHPNLHCCAIFLPGGKERYLLPIPPDKENPGPEQAGISCFNDDFAIDFADYLSRFVSQLYF